MCYHLNQNRPQCLGVDELLFLLRDLLFLSLPVYLDCMARHLSLTYSYKKLGILVLVGIVVLW